MPITLEDLHAAGVHLGHQLRRFNPRSKKFVYDHRQGISIIDLEKTLAQLTKACDFVRNTVAHGKKVLIVGTKLEAQEIVKEIATATNMPYAISRWVGGTLTNFSAISETLKKYKKHLAMEADGSMNKLPNKEASAIRREMARQSRYFEGLMELNTLPGAIIVVDVLKEKNAVAEAKTMRLPVVAIVDTNSDPTGIAYPVPGNDDALKSVRLLMGEIKQAIDSGLEEKSLRSVEKTDVASDQVASAEAAAPVPAEHKPLRAARKPRAKRDDDDSDRRDHTPIKI